MQKLLIILAIWGTAPLVAFIVDTLTIKAVAFAVICFLSAQVFVSVSEGFANVAQRQNLGSENGRRVASFLVFLSVATVACCIAAMVVAQANYFFHWVA